MLLLHKLLAYQEYAILIQLLKVMETVTLGCLKLVLLLNAFGTEHQDVFYHKLALLSVELSTHAQHLQPLMVPAQELLQLQQHAQQIIQVVQVLLTLSIQMLSAKHGDPYAKQMVSDVF